MNKKKGYFRIVVFMSILVVPTLCWLILSMMGICNKLDFNLEENREKNKIQKGIPFVELPGQIEAYYNDRVPFRSAIIKLNNKINTGLENSYEKNIVPKLLAWINNDVEDNTKPPIYIEVETSGSEIPEETNHEHIFETIDKVEPDYEKYGKEVMKCVSCGETKTYIIEKLVDNSIYPFKTIGSEVVAGRYDWLFYVKTLLDYKGENLLGENEYEAHVSALVNLKNRCDELGKELYFIVLPNKNSVYSEYMPTISTVAEKRRIELVKDYIDNNTDVKLLYPIEEMYANKPYHQLYYKYDTHWNPYGFMVGVNSLYSAMGIDNFGYEDYEIDFNLKYTGDLALLAGLDISGKEESRGDIKYKMDVEINEKDMLEDRYIEIDSTSDNKKKLVMMGDSYRFGFRLFVSKDFSHTVLFDRQLKGNEEIEKQIREADVIVIELVERNEIFLPEDTIYIYNVLSSM